MREFIEEKYQTLLRTYHFPEQKHQHNINTMIKTALREFAGCCQTPAIWCYGRHTKMLMTDFIYEMKNVRYVIDVNYQGSGESGFSIIRENDIRENNIDGIIVSSYLYKEEIKEKLRVKYPDIKYLDIYEKLEEQGVVLGYEYYSQSHPYGHYGKINEVHGKLLKAVSMEEKADLYKALLEEYIWIKDFRSAINCLERCTGIDDNFRYANLEKELKELYELEQQAIASISENNVLMLCMDGLRRKDMAGGCMPKVNKCLREKGFVYENAYSVSTSTYESLIPAYSENDDLQTKYYESDLIPLNQCSFMKEAIRQDRKVYFYTDSMQFVDSDYMKVTDFSQTASEKMWDFMLDAVDEENGLFYIHVLYESHFSYPNPYTKQKMIADGTSIFFDYLSRNGEQIRADYHMQHKDALTYLDDILSPFIKMLKCRTVIYADHGNILIDKHTALEEVEKTKLTFHEELIQVPLVIISPEMQVGSTGRLCSIKNLNQILLALMNRETYEMKDNAFIKVVRSEIYNPDFKHIYGKKQYERGLLAFEVFLFSSGYKLAIYSDGASELYRTVDDSEVEDEETKRRLLEEIREQITVYR